MTYTHALPGRRSMLVAIAALVCESLLLTAPARSAGGYETADGLAVYLGVVPAALVRGHPQNGDGAMHGGPSGGRHEQHIVVAIFDAESGERVEYASVAVSISGLGHVGHRRIALEPMTIAGTVTYGEFVNFPGRDRYEIVVEADVPGRQSPVRVTFSSDHLR